MDKKKTNSQNITKYYKECLGEKIPTDMSQPVISRLSNIFIKKGNSILSLKLLDMLIDPKYIKEALLKAVEHNRVKIVSALLESGADVNTKKKRKTLLDIAVKNGYLDMVCLLLRNKANPMMGDRKCLDKACAFRSPENPECPYLDIIRFLLKNAPDGHAIWKESGENAFLTACEKGDRRSLEILLEFCPSKTELINRAKRWGSRSPLHIASELDNINIVELLIESKASVNKTGKDGETPLYDASWNGNTDTAKLLIDSKASVNKTRKDGISPLWGASYNGNTDTARLLIESKAAVDKPGTNGRTPLCIASQEGETDTARMLIESKAAVDKAQMDGRTPLWTASYCGKTDTARLLIESKAAVDKPDEDGRTPLYIASQEGNTDTAGLLIEKKAAVDKPKNDGKTPLIAAARVGDFATVKMLIEAGADTKIRDERNQTPSEHACENRHHNIAKYLANHRFLPSRNEGIEGGAIRALKRDLLSTGLLPVGPLVIIQEFAIGEPGELAPWSLFRN